MFLVLGAFLGVVAAPAPVAAQLVCEKVNKKGRSKFKLRDVCKANEALAIDLATTSSGLDTRVTDVENQVAALASTVPGVAFAGGDTQVALVPGVGTVVETVTLDVPATGFVIVAAAGVVTCDTGNPGGAICSISRTSSIDPEQRSATDCAAVQANQLEQIAAVQGFVVDPGSQTFHFVCSDLFTPGGTNIQDARVAAIFSPAEYFGHP